MVTVGQGDVESPLARSMGSRWQAFSGKIIGHETDISVLEIRARRITLSPTQATRQSGARARGAPGKHCAIGCLPRLSWPIASPVGSNYHSECDCVRRAPTNDTGRPTGPVRC